MNPEVIERTQKYLFATEEQMREDKLTEKQINRIVRLHSMYVFWEHKSNLQDKEIVYELRGRYGVSESTAYDDVKLLKICQGNLNQLSKAYCRYIFLKRAEEGFEMARKKQDPKAFAALVSSLGKYCNLDKEEKEAAEYDRIIPQTFELSSDPEVAGFKRIPNVMERAKKLERQYTRELEQNNAIENLCEEPLLEKEYENDLHSQT